MKDNITYNMRLDVKPPLPLIDSINDLLKECGFIFELLEFNVNKPFLRVTLTADECFLMDWNAIANGIETAGIYTATLPQFQNKDKYITRASNDITRKLKSCSVMHKIRVNKKMAMVSYPLSFNQLTQLNHGDIIEFRAANNDCIVGEVICRINRGESLSTAMAALEQNNSDYADIYTLDDFILNRIRNIYSLQDRVRFTVAVNESESVNRKRALRIVPPERIIKLIQ